MLNPVAMVKSDFSLNDNSPKNPKSNNLECRFATVPDEMLRICDSSQSTNPLKCEFAEKADMRSLLLSTMVQEEDWEEDFFELQTEDDDMDIFTEIDRRCCMTTTPPTKSILRRQRNASASPPIPIGGMTPARIRNIVMRPAFYSGRHGFSIPKKPEYHPIALPPHLQQTIDDRYNYIRGETVRRLVAVHQPFDS